MAAPRHAWVVLLMMGKSYAPGALVTARSLRRQKTRHALVCMVTDDVPAETRAQLLHAFDAVVEVPYISWPTRPFAARKQSEMYDGWIRNSFTKWNCLSLTQYERVLLIDADLVFVANCDALFDLSPPAACFSNPWASPWAKGKALANPYMKNPHATCDDLLHGARIPPGHVFEALHANSFVCWGAMVLLETSADMLAAVISRLRVAPVFGQEFKALSAFDELLIAAAYSEQGVAWTHIHQKYIAIPWKPNWVSRDIHAYHHCGRKPWEMSAEEWPDLAEWWKIARELTEDHPSLTVAFGGDPPTQADADAAQILLLNDIRTTITHANGSRTSPTAVNRALSQWIMQLVNSRKAGPPGDIRFDVFDPARPLEAYLEPTGPLGWLKKTTIDAIAQLLRHRLQSPLRSTGAIVSFGALGISHGSAIISVITPRIVRMVEMQGEARTAAAVMRHAAALGSGQLCVSRAHMAHIREKLSIGVECFASPLDARLFDEGNYYSPFDDVDRPFGSLGDFFSDVAVPRGNWFVHPPDSAPVIARAVEKVSAAVARDPTLSALLLIPSSCCASLRRHPAFAHEVTIAAGAAAFETPDGRPASARKPYAYILLSDDEKIRAQGAEAIAHILRKKGRGSVAS